MGWESTRERPFESEDAKGGVRKGGWMGGEKMMEGKLERLGAWGGLIPERSAWMPCGHPLRPQAAAPLPLLRPSDSFSSSTFPSTAPDSVRWSTHQLYLGFKPVLLVCSTAVVW